MKTFSLRLYSRHDLDLIYLSNNPSISISKLVVNAIRAYVRKTGFDIPIPGEYPVKVLHSKNIKLYFNEDSDADVIRFVELLQNGCRSIAVKAIVRSYIKEPILNICYKNSDFSANNDVSEEIKTEDNHFKNKKPVNVKKKQEKTPEIKPESIKEEVLVEETEIDDTDNSNFFLGLQKLVDDN